MAFLFDPEIWASLITLTVLEIVLGIDNLLFISILSNRLPLEQQAPAHRSGLALAVITRLLLLASIAWLANVAQPLFSILNMRFPCGYLVLLGGGLFLLAKGTTEIHATVEGVEEGNTRNQTDHYVSVIVQIAILDIVFSLDSVITAVGMSQHLPVMAAVIVIAIGIMIFSAEPLSKFINTHVSVKMLALSFLILVGVALIADGLHFHHCQGLSLLFYCLLDGRGSIEFIG